MDLANAFHEAQRTKDLAGYKRRLILEVHKNPNVIGDWSKNFIEEVLAVTGPDTKYIQKLWDDLNPANEHDSSADEESEGLEDDNADVDGDGDTEMAIRHLEDSIEDAVVPDKATQSASSGEEESDSTDSSEEAGLSQDKGKGKEKVEEPPMQVGGYQIMTVRDIPSVGFLKRLHGDTRTHGDLADDLVHLTQRLQSLVAALVEEKAMITSAFSTAQSISKDALNLQKAVHSLEGGNRDRAAGLSAE